jgi:large repetitive protein
MATNTKKKVRTAAGVMVSVCLMIALLPLVAEAAPQRRLSIAEAALVEGDTGTQALSFRIVYSGKGTSGMSVGYATTALTATAGNDFISASGTVPLPSGGCKCATVTIDVLGDLEEEGSETFRIDLTNPVNASLRDGQGVGTVYDNDGPPALVVLDVVSSEADGTMSFEVSLTSSDSDTVSVDYATADVTALAGSDYSASSGTVTFTAGDVLEAISVPLLDDATAEEDQTFAVALSNPSAATVAGGLAVGTITDDDPDPSVSVVDSSATEGTSGTERASVTVTLSAASESIVEVDYATGDASAVAGSDYTAASGTLRFPPGETTGTIDVDVAGDAVHELDEDVAISLSGESNSTLADGSGLLTILDDDAEPALSVDDVTVTEGDAGTVHASFTVTKSGETAIEAGASWASADASATAGSDYTSASGSLTFAPGETTASVQVEVLGDAIDESDEQFALTLSNPVGATLTDADGTATVADDDGSPTPTSTSMSMRAIRRSTRVIARGRLEAAASGAQITVKLQVKRDGAYRTIATRKVGVGSLSDMDSDSVVDAPFTARFRRPASGRYRLRAVFGGNAQLDRCRKVVRFRL